MKRIIVFFAVLMAVFAFTACDDSSSGGGGSAMPVDFSRFPAFSLPDNMTTALTYVILGVDCAAYGKELIKPEYGFTKDPGSEFYYKDAGDIRYEAELCASPGEITLFISKSTLAANDFGSTFPPYDSTVVYAGKAANINLTSANMQLIDEYLDRLLMAGFEVFVFSNGDVVGEGGTYVYGGWTYEFSFYRPSSSIGVLVWKIYRTAALPDMP